MSALGFATSPGWLAASALASAGWLFLAWRLEGSRRRRWRLAMILVVAGCFFLLAARPVRRVAVEQGSALLLTEGATLAGLEGLAPTAGAFALPGAPLLAAERALDVALLARDHPEVDHWLLAGVGLPEWDLAALPGRVTFAAPVEPVGGIDRVTWDRYVVLGKSVSVKGFAQGPLSEGAVLRWVGPGGVEEEVALAGDASVPFEFTSRPRHEGRFEYRLVIATGGETREEVVDVVVGPRRPPVVLWLEGAPSFETRHVKSWLREMGGAMVVRSRVSRGRFRYEYLNRERVDLSRLTAELIAAFDLVVLDEAAWEGLSPTDRIALEDSVKEGLGLLLLPVAGGLPSPAPWREFELATIAELDDIEVSPSGPGVGPLEPLVVPARHLLPQDRLRPVLSDDAGRILAALEPWGEGTVAVTLIEATHRWVQRGDPESHRLYWSCLLESVARRALEGGHWSLPAGPILIDGPLPISLVATVPGAATVVEPDGTELPVPLAQDVFEPLRWHATYRPRVEGWHRLAAGGGPTSWFYAQPASAWIAWRQRQALLASERRATLGSPTGLVDAPARLVDRPLPRAWFFVALVITLGLLWADEQWRFSR